MVFHKNEIYSLNNFEGTLEFLLYLIQREEINIYDISLHELTRQCLLKLRDEQYKKIDLGAGFIGNAAYLLWLKSKTLLPIHEKENDPLLEEIEEDPNFDIIYHLLDYCRFKDAAKELADRGDRQSACFFRGINENADRKKPTGIDHISLDELSGIFKEMMTRSSNSKVQIHEENWRVSDKICLIRRLLKEETRIKMDTLFDPEKSRLEWIVIFLAVLELMKIGDIKINRDVQSRIVFIQQEITRI